MAEWAEKGLDRPQVHAEYRAFERERRTFAAADDVAANAEVELLDVSIVAYYAHFALVCL